jgi:anaphase-promoting complex subunit 8
MDRGLNYAAKWSAELLNSLPPPSSPQPHASTSQLPLETATTNSRFRTSTPVKDSIASTTNKIKNNNNRQSLPNLTHLGTINRHQRDSIGSVTGFSPHLSVNVNVEGMMEEEEDDEMWNVQRRKDELESDVYDLALSYLRTYEHLRAAHTLRDCSGPKARWLRCYTKFLVRSLLLFFFPCPRSI